MSSTPPSLSSQDRCDRCGAQAYVLAEFDHGRELLFCAHHGRKHREALARWSTKIHDESHRLEPAGTAR
ncbi:DUF7455 domain-containing protein [Kitasatospora sp. KL5]|uniref:DUF7455 domain-containing protein n=1 Tax=Kitasatospora sp. KL5 TaxID=3425125 RepID=UPI003D7001BC